MVPLPPWWAWPLAALAAFIVYGFHPIKRWRYRHLPGPPFRWLVGNLPEMIAEGQENVAARWAKQYGPGPWRYFAGGVPHVMTDNPELARKVTARPWRHSIPSLHTGQDGLFESYNIVFANHELWKAARNAWSPFFSQDSLAKLGPLMSASAGRLAAHLGAADDEGRPMDICRELGRMTMDVVGTTAFGVNFNTLERSKQEGSGQQQEERLATPADRMGEALRAFFDTFGLGSILWACCFLVPEAEPLVRWLANVLPTKSFRREQAGRVGIREVGTELVQAHLEHARAAAAGSAPGSGSPGRPQRPRVVDPGSFLALVTPLVGQRAGEHVLGELWAANQATAFILAGYETTANLLSYCIYLLALHPEHEAKVLAEVDAFGRERTPTAADLEASFPHTQAVIHEALRLYPPAPLVIREPPAGGMELGGVWVPGDAKMQVPIFSMHRNPRWWKEPDAFKPERFLPGTPEAAEVVPGAYIPFGDGTRKCIGWRFGLMEAGLSLVQLLQQYTFRLLPGQVPLKTKMLLTMAPAGGVRVTVHRRT
ncbi:hypothetical protein ABPG75_005262 [Micractinium tetrahymenae]